MMRERERDNCQVLHEARTQIRSSCALPYSRPFKGSRGKDKVSRDEPSGGAPLLERKNDSFEGWSSGGVGGDKNV